MPIGTEPRTELEADVRRVRVWLLLPVAYLLSASFSLFGPTLRVLLQDNFIVPEAWEAEANLLFPILSLVFVYVAFVPRGTHHLLGLLRRWPEPRAWLWVVPAGVASYLLSVLMVRVSSAGVVGCVAQGGAALALLRVVAAPLAEELFFRNLLFVRFRFALGASWALLLSALLFAALHSSPLSAFVFALLCQVAYLRTKSLWAPIAVHGLHNGLVDLGARWGAQRSAVEASNQLEPALAALFVACVAAPLLVLVYRAWPSLRRPLEG